MKNKAKKSPKRIIEKFTNLLRLFALGMEIFFLLSSGGGHLGLLETTKPKEKIIQN